MTTVSNCGHDGRGAYRGDIAGDQTGDEWCIIPWVDYGQDAILRHPDPVKRGLMAKLAVQAARNDMIGYDQGERTTFDDCLVAAGDDPSAISEPCEADCSSGVAAIVRAVGRITGDGDMASVSPWMTTYYEVPILTAAGFTVLWGDEYTRSGSRLVAGDVICRQDLHTCIVVEGDGEAMDYDPDIAYMQRLLNIQLMRRGWDQVAADGSYGPETASALIRMAQEWMLCSMDPTVAVNGSWYAGWVNALQLHPIRQGMACAGSWAVKAALVGQGFKGSALDLDSWDFGPGVADALKEFQASRGIEASGRADSDTLFALTHWD